MSLFQQGTERTVGGSIGEFCEPGMKIYMFDKFGEVIVKTVEEVSRPFARFLFLWMYNGCRA